jgi:hypothetical protein
VKQKNLAMLRAVSRDSSSSKFNGLLRMTLLNVLRRLCVDSHEEEGKVTGEETE